MDTGSFFSKDLFGFVSVFLALVSNGSYFVSVLTRKTKPHVFSWTIWGLLTGITFFAQSSSDAGPGAWHMAVNSVVCFIVAALAVFRGSFDITRTDIISFSCALLALPVWYITQTPLTAVIIVIFVEFFAYYSTFRKSYAKPHEELAFAYSVDAIRCVVSLFAMESYSVATMLYPLFIVCVSSSLVGMLLYRRRVLNNPAI